MQQKKTRRGREYLNDFRRDVNGSYLYQGSYRRYTGSMPYAKLRSLLWALCGGALAALAAAGKDVAALNGIDVRAFTGQAKFCKKAAAGYSNCCKDSGWGQDIGLAKCSSDEKALAKAKTNKLTVSVGEFCSKKVLGVCLEKKRSYCQFDSKLAQIVQQQGRNGQLHISFGSSKHPDCRGITVDELQQIKFDQLDLTNFYEDLMNNQKIPDSGALTEKVKEQIADQLRQAGK